MAPHRPHDTQPPRAPVRSRPRESVTHASSRVAAGRGDNRGSPPSGGRYGILLLVLIATYLLSAFTTGRLITGLQAALFLALLLIALRTAPLTRRTARLTGAVALAGSAAAAVVVFTGTEDGAGAADIWNGLLLLATAVVIVRRVLGHPAVTLQSIYGALSAYMIIGLMFAAFYAAIGRARQQPVLRERAACERQDLSVLQLRHTDYAWLRRLHRCGQQRQGHSGPRGADRPGVPRDPRRPAGCRLPAPGTRTADRTRISHVALGGQPPGRDSVPQGTEIALVLVGVQVGEFRDCLVEDVRAAQVRRDSDPVPGPGVRPG